MFSRGGNAAPPRNLQEQNRPRLSLMPTPPLEDCCRSQNPVP